VVGRLKGVEKVGNTKKPIGEHKVGREFIRKENRGDIWVSQVIETRRKIKKEVGNQKASRGKKEEKGTGGGDTRK